MNYPATPRKALGRGLDSLLKPASSPTSSDFPDEAPQDENSAVQRLIPVGAIRPNPFQPRKHFATEGLQEMAASIRQHGLLQPILVRPDGAGFQLVAGERRWRAAQLAGLDAIPALVQPFSDERALEFAIVENLQREDLNPLEQARAFQQLALGFHLTQEQIAQRTGKDRTTISNFLRLLKLEAEVQQWLEEGQLSMGQARALLAWEGEAQIKLAQQAIRQGLTVRRLEKLAARPAADAALESSTHSDPNVREAQEQLARALGAKVRVIDHVGRGTIMIDYFGLEDFQRLYDRLLR